MKNSRSSPPASPAIEHLKEISFWVHSVQDPDQLLELVVATAARMLDARASSLLLVDPHSRKLHFKVATGEKGADVKRFQVDMGEGIAGHVASTGQPLLIPDVSRDPRWQSRISASIGYDTRSIACAPLKVNGEIIGVLEVIDRADGGALRAEDMPLLAVFADVAATAIANARRIDRDRKSIRDLQAEMDLRYEIVGESRAIRRVIADALKVAEAKTSTLIVGESGTGKELLARLIHRASPRRDAPMVVLNCAALPEPLLEDELFGHERGAFTGAIARKIGKFEIADGGTLFLDEIGEMSPIMQSKLLRILQEGVFYRLGGNAPIAVDVRALAATHRDIEREVAEGRFREDLYYRLNVVQIRMPALRERREDIPRLAEHFLGLFRNERSSAPRRFSREALERMQAYDWPGNVREMKNAIERAVVMGGAPEIRVEDLPAFARPADASDGPMGRSFKEAVDAFKRDLLAQSLRQNGGNRGLTARNLHIQRTYLSRLIAKYGLQDL
jgi:Nif-specific regulatory protein